MHLMDIKIRSRPIHINLVCITMRVPLAALVSAVSTTKYSLMAAVAAASSVNTSAFVIPATTEPRNFVVGAATTTTTHLSINTSLPSSGAAAHSSPLDNSTVMADAAYPGTAVERMMNVRKQVEELASTAGALDGDWGDVRRKILWAGGLRDLPDAQPGQVRKQMSLSVDSRRTR
jgi:hypothetical protein